MVFVRLSLCINPALFLRGATPLNSWPLLLIYDQNLFLFSPSLTTSSIYCLCAFLVSLCTSCCNLLYLSQSLFYLVRMAFACAICFWLIVRRTFVFIHGWVCRALVIFFWNPLVYDPFDSCFKMVLHTFNAIKGLISEVFTKYCNILYILAFFHRDILCRVGFGLIGLHAISSNTMSW